MARVDLKIGITTTRIRPLGLKRAKELARRYGISDRTLARFALEREALGKPNDLPAALATVLLPK